MPDPAPTDADRGAGAGGLLRTALPVAVAGGLFLSHLEVLSKGPGYAGPLLALDHLFDTLLTLAAVGLSASLGRWVLRRLRLEPEGAAESFLHSVAVGAGGWSLLFLLLGAVRLLSGPWIGVAVLIGALVARRELGQLPGAVSDVAREVRRRAGDRWLLGLAGAAALGVALFLLINGSAPPGDWDSLMYHLEVPREWLAAGRIYLPDDNLHAAYVGLVQLLYVPFLALGSPSAAALLNGAFALLLGLAVFDAGARLFDSETGTLSAILLWASTGLLLVAITARVDTTLAFYLLLGQTALAGALREPGRAGENLLRAGLILGLGTGVKYLALAYGACLVPVGLWASWRGGRSGAERGRLVALAGGVSLILALPWMIKNVLLVGAPFYPFFAARQLQPWLARLYGSSAVPASVSPAVFRSLGRARQHFGLLKLFLAPQLLTVEPEAVHYHLDPFFLLLPLWLLHLRRREATALIGPPLLYVAGLMLFRPTTNLRYLFPAIPPLTVATSWLAVATARRLAGSVVRRVVLGVLAAAALVPTIRSAVTWTRGTPALGQAVGTVSRQSYLAGGFSFYADMVGAVNRTVPMDGKVLLLWEARGFYLAPPHLQDNLLTNWPLLEPWLRRTGDCLGGTGITHVLASTGAAGYYVSRGADPAVLGLERFGAFARRCLVPVVSRPGFTLYRVRDAGPS